MKKFFITTTILISFLIGCQQSPRLQLVSTTEQDQWYPNANVSIREYSEQDSVDVEILPDALEQTIDGFGGCFNELGWEALQVLSPDEKQKIFESLFSARGCNFNICRMPIGANDFALDWYSLDETDGDYAMEHFNIDRDMQRLVPFIKSAMAVRPDLQVWGSPWCPPSWMKKNHYYACSPSPYNDLDPSQPRDENGETGFITDEQTLSAYALYFTKYIDAYREQGIPVFAVHVQNEPHSCQSFPSCLWKGPDLKNFVRDYLGPEFEKQGLDTEIWYGTFERPYEGEWKDEIDGVLSDPKALQYITGFGFQWAGKNAIGAVHAKNPDLKLMHTEVECGDGQNTWASAEYTWELLRHYFENGVNSQMYWNLVLSQDQISHWGWKQNSMISVNGETGEVVFNPEFYVMKHFSHFIKSGSHKLAVTGDGNSTLAFVNPDGGLVMNIHNPEPEAREISVKYGDRLITLSVAGHSINTVTLSGL